MYMYTHYTRTHVHTYTHTHIHTYTHTHILTYSHTPHLFLFSMSAILEDVSLISISMPLTKEIRLKIFGSPDLTVFLLDLMGFLVQMDLISHTIHPKTSSLSTIPSFHGLSQYHQIHSAQKWKEMSVSWENIF